MDSEPLDTSLRIRCEPELKTRLAQVAKRNYLKPAAAARQALWLWIEAEEKRLGIAPADPVPDKSKAMRTAQASQDDAERLASLNDRPGKITKYPHGKE